MATITMYETLTTTSCCVCGINFAVPEDFLKKRYNDPNKDFFCPNGHSLSYRKPAWEKEMDQLKRDKEELERSRMALHNELHRSTQKAKSLERKLKSTNKRIAAGVCPCCNRTVSQLAKHIETMHPEFANAKKPTLMHTKINSK